MKKIKVLVVSDIHSSYENIEKCKEYISKNDIKLDLIICPGDLSCLKNYNDEEDIKKSEGILIITH
jgi:Icc-related predicted phosphoesterase